MGKSVVMRDMGAQGEELAVILNITLQVTAISNEVISMRNDHAHRALALGHRSRDVGAITVQQYIRSAIAEPQPARVQAL